LGTVHACDAASSTRLSEADLLRDAESRFRRFPAGWRSRPRPPRRCSCELVVDGHSKLSGRAQGNNVIWRNQSEALAAGAGQDTELNMLSRAASAGRRTCARKIADRDQITHPP